MLPESENLEAHCATLETIANSYLEGSSERAALLAAAFAMHYVSHVETQTKFRAWVDSWSAPPSALQVLHAKLMGIDDLPHELLDESMREVEQLMEKLRHLRT